MSELIMQIRRLRDSVSSFLKLDILVGRVFLNLVFFWSLPFRFSDPLCYEFFLVWVSHYLGEMWLNTQAGLVQG